MVRMVDRLAAHWLASKGKLRRRTFKIGDEEITVCWSAWTLDQQDFVYHDWVRGEAFRPERFARIVLRKALKEDGERMFADAEMPDLLHRIDPELVKAIASAILADLDEDNQAAAAGDDPKATAAEGAAATPTT